MWLEVGSRDKRIDGIFGCGPRGSKVWWGEQQQVVLFAGPSRRIRPKSCGTRAKRLQVASHSIELTRWMDSPILADRSGIGERWHTTEVGIYEKDPPV